MRPRILLRTLECPSPRRGRRVAILYKGPFFACRHCLGLGYACPIE